MFLNYLGYSIVLGLENWTLSNTDFLIVPDKKHFIQKTYREYG